MSDFANRNREMAARMSADPELRELTRKWFEAASRYGYSYQFTWLGRPIIQFPQDIIAVQEVIWQTQPDLIIETGVAHGGSLIFSASLLELMGGDRQVIGINVEIRPHNRTAIEQHLLAHRITLIEGSSTAPEVVARVQALAAKKSRVLVLLDSNHTYAHVRDELRLYAPLVKAGSYLIVFDTDIEHLPQDMFPNRPWGPGNNPMTAVNEFLQSTDRFRVDEELEAKLLISVAPRGYLKCVKD